MKNKILYLAITLLFVLQVSIMDCGGKKVVIDDTYPKPDISVDDPPCAAYLYPLYVRYLPTRFRHGYSPCYSEQKVVVVTVPKLKITACNIPNHKIVEKPVRNPFLIIPVVKDYYIPLEPVDRKDFLPIVDTVRVNRNNPRINFGITLSGVELDPAALEAWKKNHPVNRNLDWTYEAMFKNIGLDKSHAHKQPLGPASTTKYGRYHYHGHPTGYINKLNVTGKEMVQIGWAADGYPIFYKYGQKKKGGPIIEFESGYSLKSGVRSENIGSDPGVTGPCGVHNGKFVQDWEYVKGKSDLDMCNGIEGYAPGFGNTYYYVVTDQFPWIPRCFKAEPDISFFII